MKILQLLHNPSAGDEAHQKDNLISQIETAGFRCRYNSTKEPGWKEIPEDADLIVIAGGDGTVRKVARQVLKNKTIAEATPIGVLALGTANNVAKTFGLSSDTEQMLAVWKDDHRKKVDIGRINNIPEVEFFLEGFGFGMFPLLMKVMKRKAAIYNSTEEELVDALKTLHHILSKFKPRHCELEVDGTDHSGMFYMVEVMNIRSIGPNMVLAPLADPGDGELEVVLVPEAHREQFSNFLMHKLSGGDDPYLFPTLKGKEIKIRWDGCRYHADDKMMKLTKQTEVKVKIEPGALQFLVPREKEE